MLVIVILSFRIIGQKELTVVGYKNMVKIYENIIEIIY